ncbi:MAG: hypothetical protein WC455_29605 [Dehalococcoidia bacterium]
MAMTETQICPIMSRPRGLYPATSKTVKTSVGIPPLVWHDEYPCIKGRCVAWTEYPLGSGKMHGYCRLVGNEP